MGIDEQSAEPSYKAVVNPEGQYALWPAGRDNAPGWQDAGMAGTEADVLARIREAWQDMTPRSVLPPHARRTD